MCMGGGGGGQQKIVMPKTEAYDRQFELQRAAIEQQMNNSSMLMQQQLQASLRSKEELTRQIAEIKTEKANDAAALDEQAKRMSVLIGAPPPEPTAKAPAVGEDRNSDAAGVRKRGKSRLRIQRTTAMSSGQGSGLNIT